jgi:hypothetical protein
MQQSPSLKTNSSLASEELPRMLWNTKVHHNVDSIPALVTVLHHVSTVHVHFTIFF